MAKKTKLSPQSIAEAKEFKLTDNQIAFAHLVALEGHSATAAYAKVYDPKGETSYTESVIAGKALLEHPAILKHIDELQAPVIARSGISLESHMYYLQKIRDGAIENRNFNAAVAAEVARGRAAGFYDRDSDDDKEKDLEPSKVVLMIEDASIVDKPREE